MSDGTPLLPGMLSLAVPMCIQQLQDLPPSLFWQRWEEWRDRAWDEGAFSEAVLYCVKGESARAFSALARLIAVMAFVPGGVSTFGLHFEATPPGMEKPEEKLEEGAEDAKSS